MRWARGGENIIEEKRRTRNEEKGGREEERGKKKIIWKTNNKGNKGKKLKLNI